MKRNRNSVIRASYKISPGIHNRQVSVSWSGSWSAIQESLLQKDLLFIFACVCIIYAHLCGCSSVHVSVGARDWSQISFVVVLHFVYRGRVSHWSKLANLPQGSPISISWVLGLYWAPMPIRISCECWNPVSGPHIGSSGLLLKSGCIRHFESKTSFALENSLSRSFWMQPLHCLSSLAGTPGGCKKLLLSLSSWSLSIHFLFLLSLSLCAPL